MTTNAPRLISVDWGTTSLRCYLVSAGGGILGLHTSPEGIMAVPDGRYGATLDAALKPWITHHGWLPIVMSGMIGSRQGWHEAPYVRCPARLSDVAAQCTLLSHDGLPPIYLAPGVDTEDTHGTPDVMRGEEMQIFGALAEIEEPDAVFTLPGTHAKWALIEDGAIARFRTYMTGEVFAALKGHTILGRLMAGSGTGSDGFVRGVKSAVGVAPGDLLHMIFSARTLVLFDRLEGADVESYLSGLLIGAEIASARAWVGSNGGAPVRILGNSDLAARYQIACEALGVACSTIDSDSVVLGHLALLDAVGASERK